MKNLIRVTILLFLLVAVLLPGTAFAQAPGGNKLVLGGIYSLKSGETLNGNLIVLGGMATLQEGSRVNGDVLVAGGTLDASGTVNGNVYATGGLVTLNELAIVTGDVTTLGAHLERSPQAQVQGSLNTNNPGVIPAHYTRRNPHPPDAFYPVQYQPICQTIFRRNQTLRNRLCLGDPGVFCRSPCSKSNEARG